MALRKGVMRLFPDKTSLKHCHVEKCSKAVTHYANDVMFREKLSTLFFCPKHYKMFYDAVKTEDKGKL